MKDLPIVYLKSQFQAENKKAWGLHDLRQKRDNQSPFSVIGSCMMETKLDADIWIDKMKFHSCYWFLNCPSEPCDCSSGDSKSAAHKMDALSDRQALYD